MGTCKIDKKTYMVIKTYNHKQMEQFIYRIREGGRGDGVAVFLGDLIDGKCKGVGRATVEKLIDYAKETGLIGEDEEFI